MAEELGLQQHPQARRGEEGQHQEQRGMHRIARGDHAQRGEAPGSAARK
jgi:hypothetical protein